MNVMTAEEWMQRFAAELGRHLQDVQTDDLAVCAAEAIEERRYRDLDPEVSAALWARDFA